MNLLLNIVFHLLHLFTIFFCTFGWIYEPFRLANLLLLLAVAFSWFVLGHLTGNGYGYCLLTDLQWKLKKSMNRPPATDSYVKFMADMVSGRDNDPALVDRATSVTFFASLAISLLLNTGLI